MLQMQHKNSWCLVLTLVLLSALVSAVRINEIMPNPDDKCSDCTEWVELYSDAPINMTDWQINTTNQKTNLSFYIQDYLIITKNKSIFLNYWNADANKIFEWRGMSLANAGEPIFLFNKTSIIDGLVFPMVPENKSYSLSNLGWIVCEKASPGKENSCETSIQSQNKTNENITQKEAMTLEFNDEFFADKSIEIDVKAENLNGSYDMKMYLTTEDDKIISEIYDDSWKSGIYYILQFFTGTGNKTKTSEIKISKEYLNFTGKANLIARLRKNSDIIIEIRKDVRIKQRQELAANPEADYQNKSEEKEEIILLNPKDIKTPEIWKSKASYIKDYGVYSFIFLCVLLVILLIIKKI